jgi:hypothetical protein
MDKFVQNVHGNSIKIRCETPGGIIPVFEKVFPIQKFDFNGIELQTGFTRLTEQEFAICRRDKLFIYFQQLGKLIVHDQLPSSAQTPHEALLEARKQIRAVQDQLHAAQVENEKLKKQLAKMIAGKGGKQHGGQTGAEA